MMSPLMNVCRPHGAREPQDSDARCDAFPAPNRVAGRKGPQLGLPGMLVLLTLTLTTHSLRAGIVETFADIQLWTGSGANQAALVVDWVDARDPLVWGYRFDTATSSDMLRAVVESDSRLFAKVEQFVFGQFVHGLGYDRNGNGFSISSGTNFGPAGFTISGARDGAVASDPSDSYRETDSGFSMNWGLWTSQGSTYPGAGWLESQIGISDRQLTNQSWDAFRFNTPGTAPGTAIAAIPEPTALGWLVPGWLVLGSVGYRGRRALARAR